MSSSSPPYPKSGFRVSALTAKRALMGLFSVTAVIWLGSRTLLSVNFLPHWYCYLGNRPLLWSNVIGDLVIGLSYLAITSTLIWLVRRAGRDLPYRYFFWAFGLFIVSCGATHFIEVITVWKPFYWLLAATKLVTAIASAGTAILLIVAADDIVEFVRTAREAGTRRGNEQFRALVHAAPMAVISADASGKITAWNPAAERTFGFLASEVVGSILGALVPPDKLEEQTALRQRTLAGESITGFETVRLDRTGSAFLVSISTAPLVDEAGAVAGTVGVIEDISERKRIERELHEKTDLLSTVTPALNVYLDVGEWAPASRELLAFAIQKTQSEYGFLGVVLDGHVLRILAHDGVVWDTKLNRELYEERVRQFEARGYFDVLPDHNLLLGDVVLKGQTIITNFPISDPRARGVPEGHPAMHALLGVPIFKGKETVGLIAVANRPGGYTGQELRHLEAMSQATGVLYDNYRQTMKRSILEEEQKRLESQVHQAQKMEVLGRLAGGVAHDFNNMLMVFGGGTELLDRSLPADSPSRIYLDQIQRTTDKAAAITKQLLTFSRKQVLEIHPMDLHATLTESEFILPRLLGSDIQLTFHYDAEKSWILSAPTQIEQVIANLAINARDAMIEGGHLAISTRNATVLPQENAESPSLSGEWVVLEVSDTGAGIDEKARAQLFEPFFTTKLVGKGTGLGLATVYGIVKQSKGHIRVDSAPGKGARFELYFPLVETLAPELQVSPKADSQKHGRGTILVVDDEPALRQAVVEILRSSGYTVLEARSAHEAVEIAERHTGELDVLLTDIVMPVMRGPEVARRIAKLHPLIHVIFMSGYAEGLPEAELPANSAFLQKPFRFATLLEQLKLVRRRA